MKCECKLTGGGVEDQDLNIIQVISTRILQCLWWDFASGGVRQTNAKLACLRTQSGSLQGSKYWNGL